MGCTSSKDPIIAGKSGRTGSQDLKKAQSMYVTSTAKGSEVEDPPQVDVKGHLMPEEVRKRIVGSSQVQTTIVGTEEQTEIQYAYITQRGYYPNNLGQQNQDDYSITLKLGGEANDVMFAVYDGHGSNGHGCAVFTKTDIPRSVAKYIRQKRSSRHIAKLKAEGKPTKGAFRPELWSTLEEKEYGECCRKAFEETNKALHDNAKINDKLSGTTVVTVSFHRGRMTVCNLGDSRALLGSRMQEDGTIQSIPLSMDQTPHRKDERERVQAAGAEIKSIDQLQGREEPHDDWGDIPQGGEVENPHKDPPRIWVKGNEFPGTAFTRSIGDTVAENIGVIAQPEIVSRELTENDTYLVIATDGLFEFLKNKQVMEIVEKSSDPVDACEKLRKAAYEQWLQHEDRVDDITIIVCFLSKTATPTD
mmetsp:Transcript_37358/g.90722  ORF Transcript_37358/g.90722 Transcript_37358/m.90722 type:complete len:418 (-) Transcript_37358:121-1374(-)